MISHTSVPLRLINSDFVDVLVDALHATRQIGRLSLNALEETVNCSCDAFKRIEDLVMINSSTGNTY